MGHPDPIRRSIDADVIEGLPAPTPRHPVVRRLPSLLGAAAVALAVALAVADLHGPEGPAPAPRPAPTSRLPALAHPVLLTLETPPQPGTPLSGWVPSSAGPFRVRAECIGTGLLTVSLNAETGFALRCRRAGRTVERPVSAADLGAARPRAGPNAFVLAQVGNAERDTVWRVTVRGPR